MSTLRTHPETNRALLDLVDTQWQATQPTDLVPRAQCVDDLLDLYGMTDDPAVHEEIGAVLAGLAGRTLLEGTEVHSALARVVAAAEVEAAFARLVIPATEG
jgi:hypothetical protein